VAGVTLVWQACLWLHDQPWATTIRESEITFPALETVHVLSLALMVGGVAIVDLRLLGLAFRRESVAELAAPLLTVTWIGFVAMASTGLLLFAAEATDMFTNPAFRLKMLLLLAAGGNMLIFHFTAYRDRLRWTADAPAPPATARIAAALSLTLWAGVVVSGRAIAYFHHHA